MILSSSTTERKSGSAWVVMETMLELLTVVYWADSMVATRECLKVKTKAVMT